MYAHSWLLLALTMPKTNDKMTNLDGLNYAATI
uniref:Uncharacterized protein n=1 Tax=Anguilla anguilla TaxID=7936 RepID=A0A0E9T7C0_ANGAN